MHNHFFSGNSPNDFVRDERKTYEVFKTIDKLKCKINRCAHSLVFKKQ